MVLHSGVHQFLHRRQRKNLFHQRVKLYPCHGVCLFGNALDGAAHIAKMVRALAVGFLFQMPLAIFQKLNFVFILFYLQSCRSNSAKVFSLFSIFLSLLVFYSSLPKARYVKRNRRQPQELSLDRNAIPQYVNVFRHRIIYLRRTHIPEWNNRYRSAPLVPKGRWLALALRKV